MTFEDILARCLDALEQGETIENCVDRYPQHATELISLLNLAIAVRSTPQPRLSANGFARGQAVVMAQARLQQAHHAPFKPAHVAAARQLPAPIARTQPLVAPQLMARPPKLAKPFLFIYKAQSALIALLVVLSFFTLLRNISSSLPGASLYSVKILGENMQGVLLTAAGEQAIWHAHQTEIRLQELVQLGQRDQIASAALEQSIEQQVLATLTASNQLRAEQRDQFLLAWMTRLRALDKDNQSPSTVAQTLNRTLATIQNATQVTIALPMPGSQPIQTVLPTPTPAAAQVGVPTVTSNPVTAEARLAEPTTPPATRATVPTAEPANIHPPSVSPDLAPAPTALATATMASIIVQVPQETSTDDDNQPEQPNKAAVAQPEATTAPVVAAADPQLPDSGDNGQSAVQPSTSVTTSLEMGSGATSTGHTSKSDAPKATVTPAFGIVDAPTPAIGSGPAIAPATALVTEVATSATPDQTASPNTSTPGADKPATSTAMPSSTESNTPIPVPSETPTSEPEKTVDPTATSKPTATVKPTRPDPTDTPDQSEATEEPPTSTPESTPTPKKRK